MKKYAIEPFNPSAKIQALTGFGHSNGEDEEGNEESASLLKIIEK